MAEKTDTPVIDISNAAPGTIFTGLIGVDIQNSRSPAMHMREAAAQGISLDYRLFDLANTAQSTEDLTAMLDAVERAGFAGVNVTHPFKQRVIPLLQELSDEAAAIGAVNTIVFGDGWRIGYNTDSSGFGEGFERQLGGVDISRIVQVGAGGAGAATAMAMVNLGCGELVIVDPQGERAADLVERLSGHRAQTLVRVVQADLTSELAAASGIINATPIGMDRHPGTPIDPALLRADLWVAEVVYFPLETELLRIARAMGCRTAHGGDMAVFQAARAFDLFTGRQADRHRMTAHF